MEQQDKIYFTLTGTCFYFGQEFLEAGMEVTLKKEPDNKHDKEAILVTMPGLGKIGYVANSPKTVLGESMSAGRLYDRIGDEAAGIVRYVLPDGVVCALAGEYAAPHAEVCGGGMVFAAE